jgi:hypothetical protein
MSLTWDQGAIPIAVWRKKLGKDQFGKPYPNDGVKDGRILYSNPAMIFGEKQVLPVGGSPYVDIVNGQLNRHPVIGGHIHSYLPGATGTGKSFKVSDDILEHLTIDPDARVFVISGMQDLEHHAAYHHLRNKDTGIEGEEGYIRGKYRWDLVPLEMFYGKKPITFNDFEPGSFVVFDDCGTIEPPELNRRVHALQKDLLECGRRSRISVAITSHIALNGQKSRAVFADLSDVTLYPQGTTHGIRALLEEYCDFSPFQIYKFLNIPSHWGSVLTKGSPVTILHSKGAYILPRDDNEDPEYALWLKSKSKKATLARAIKD